MFAMKKTDMNPYQAYRIKKLKYQLKNAETYSEWKSIALQLDEETGSQEWKFDNSSPYFDAELISYRLNLLRKFRLQQHVLDTVYLLQEGLTHDIANIGHPMLFASTYVGTKQIIEDYIEEVSASLAFVAGSQCQTLTHAEKIRFLKIVKKPMGSRH